MRFRRLTSLGVAGALATGCGPQASSTPASKVPPPAQVPERNPEEDAIKLFGPEFVARVKGAGGQASASEDFIGRVRVRLSGDAVADADLDRLAPLKDRLSGAEVNIEGTRVTADGLAKLAGYKLHRLVIPESARTDAGLPHYLAAIDADDRLDLSGWAVTDEGLRSLAGGASDRAAIFNPLATADARAGRGAAPATLLQLDSLDLSRAKVTDAGVIWLAGALTNSPQPARLRALNLSHTAITDASLEALSAVKSLRRIAVEGTKITDAGLASLPPDLDDLDLSDTAVTDEGMETVGRLKKLAHLSVSRTRITDAGLASLAGLAALRMVFVAGSRVTPSGVQRFGAGHSGASVNSEAHTAGQRRGAISSNIARGGFGSTGRTSAGSSGS